MTIDLSAVPTLTDSLGLYDIPLNVDTFPYGQLGAQGRYPDRSTPNTLPEFLATLNATDANFAPDMLSTDGKRNLNVNVAAGGGGGGGLSPTAMKSRGFLGNAISGDSLQSLGALAPGATTLYAMQWDAWVAVANGVGSNEVRIDLVFESSTGGVLVVAQLGWPENCGPLDPPSRSSGHLSLPVPCLFPAAWAAGTITLYANPDNNLGTTFIQGSVQYS